MTAPILALFVASAFAGVTVPSSGPTPTGDERIGSVAFNGVVPPSWGVVLNGSEVPWVPSMKAFVAADLPITTVPFMLVRNGEVVMTAAYTPTPGVHELCGIIPGNSSYQTACGSAGISFRKVDLGEIPATTTGVSISVVTKRAPAPTEPVTDAQLQTLIQTVVNATYGSDQVGVIRTAAPRLNFTCEQVVRLLAPLSFGSDKLEALRALVPRIVDPQNAYLVEQAFTFSSDKEAARAMFR